MVDWMLGKLINIHTVTVTGTAGVKESLLGLDSWIAAAEEVSLQTASEGGKRRCNSTRPAAMRSANHTSSALV